MFSVSRVVLSLEELCLYQSFARKSMCRSNVTAPVSWSIISCSDSTCFFPSGIQTVGNYFSMCKSLVAWILGRNWGRLKRRKVRLWIACRKLNYISVWILKRWFFFFEKVLSPWCALWCWNTFDMLSFQGLSSSHMIVHCSVPTDISLPHLNNAKFLRGCDLKYSSSAHLLHFISQGKWFHRSRHEQTRLSNGCLNGL